MAIEIPDPPFGDQTEAIIRDRMFAEMDSALDQSQGSMAFNLITPLAIELSQLWDGLDQLVLLTFIQTTTGKFLDGRGEEHGVFRVVAASASGTVVFSGANGTVPSGTQVSNTVLFGSAEEPAVFETTSDAVISGGSAPAVTVVAVDPAEAGNLVIGGIDRMVDSVAIVTSVTNDTATIGGRDDETDDVFRVRLLKELEEREGSGGAGDYKRWAKEASTAVVFVSVVPGVLPAVDIYVFQADFTGVGASEVVIIADYIADRQPLGADVTVIDGQSETIAIVSGVTYEKGFNEFAIGGNIVASINAYFDTLEVDEDVLQAAVAHAIMDTTGVLDIPGFPTLDGVGADYTPTAGFIARPGSINLT